MADSEYSVSINIRVKDLAQAAAKKAAAAVEGIGKSAKKAGREFDKAAASIGDQIKGLIDPAKAIDGFIMGIGQSVGNMAASALAEIPKIAKELFDLGVKAETVAHRFGQFSGSAEASAEYLAAFQSATDGTIPKLDAMASASKMLQMGLVDNAGEMETMASIATKLGDQTMGAGDRLSDFSALLANKSIPRLDNFGISSSKVRARVEELTKAGKDVDEAFKLAVLEQGSLSLAKLGDTSDLAATKISKVSAAWADVKVELGESMVEMATANVETDNFAATIRLLPEAIKMSGGNVNQLAGNLVRLGVEAGKAQGELDRMDAAANSSTRNYTAMARAQAETAGRTTEWSRATDELKDKLNSQVTSQGMLEHTILATADAIQREGIPSQNELEGVVLGAAKAIEAETVAMDAFVTGMDAAAQLNLSMNFTRQLESMQESTAKFAADREAIEAEHQAKVAELQKKGASRSVQINVGAEQEKLAKLKFTLDQAQLKIDEMTGKEKQSTQNAKQQALITAQQRYAEQQKLLEDYSAGRLVTAGQNVDALIAEENRRKEAAIAALDEQMAKQQEVQDKAMGQMMLQAFDQWGAQKDIPVEKMLEMRTAIAEEYGLVGEGATALVTDMVDEWDVWAEGTKVSTDEVIKYMGGVIDETGEVRRNLLDMTAAEYVIKVRYDVTIPDVVPPPWQDTDRPGLANGGSFMVGEAGAEMVTVQPVSRSNTYNDTFNVYDGRAMAAVQENRRRQRRSGIARTM